MSDRDDDKIVSLDRRRREDQARQRAEIAAAEAARRRTNGAGRNLNRPFGQPMGRPRPPGAGAASIGRALGKLLSWVVWGGLVVLGALAAVQYFNLA